MLSYIAGKMQAVKSLYHNATAKAGALDEYLGAAIMFVVIGVAVSVGAYITAQVQTQIGVITNTCSAGNTINTATGLCNAGVTTLSGAYNAGGNAVTGMGTFATWLPIVAIVLVAVVIIGLLYGFFRGSGASEAA